MTSSSPNQPVVPFCDLGKLHGPTADELASTWQEVLSTAIFVGGPHIERFEQAWATYCGTRNAVGVSSGCRRGAARAAGTSRRRGRRGDRAGQPFVATVEAIVAVGATPRFLDVDPDTLLVTAQGLSAGLTPRTAAVIVVHLYGQMPDMEALLAVSTKAGIELIEDAAQAHGAAWNGRRAGTWGRAGCFSFFPTKNLGALGDAGIVVTADDELAGRVRALANHGRPAGSWHSHRFAGGNSRLDSLQAALLSAKLPHLERWNRARRQAAAHYERLLVGMPVRPLSRPVAADSVHHLEVVRLDRRDVRTHLRARGVETGVHYPVPVHAQEAYSHFHTGPLLATEDAAKTVLSLPLFPDITGSQIEYVSQALAEATGGDPVGG